MLERNGPAVTNNDGDVETQVSANKAAGFSIVTSLTPGRVGTYGHGLNKAPEFFIWKSVTGNDPFAGNAYVYHNDLGNSAFLMLNSNSEKITDSTLWGNASPTDTVLSLNSTGQVAVQNDVFTAGTQSLAIARLVRTRPMVPMMVRLSIPGSVLLS